MSDTTRDVYVDGKLDSKIIERNKQDGSHETIVEQIHSRDVFGIDSATISQTITTKPDGTVIIKNR